MYVGSKYDRSRSLTEVARLVRSDIKSAVAWGALPKGKYTVRTERSGGGRSLWIGIPQDLPRATIAPKLAEMANEYNYDKSEITSDYFDTNFYVVFV